MHVVVDYPSRDAEQKILHLVRQESKSIPSQPPRKLTQLDLVNARKDLLNLHMAEPVERYLVELVMASRSPQGELAQWLDYGSSPRGTIGLDTCARALAWLDGRDFVTPQDIQSVTHDVLRHRLILSFEASAQGITNDQVIDLLLQNVPVP
jgi:MoxR-like ATPase